MSDRTAPPSTGFRTFVATIDRLPYRTFTGWGLTFESIIEELQAVHRSCFDDDTQEGRDGPGDSFEVWEGSRLVAELRHIPGKRDLEIVLN